MVAVPKPKRNNLCENPHCKRKATRKYKGYYTYKLCGKCYAEWYHCFRMLIMRLHDGKCVECGSTDRVTVHHKILRSQGGRHIYGNCVILCEFCHNKAHGIKTITY